MTLVNPNDKISPEKRQYLRIRRFQTSTIDNITNQQFTLIEQIITNYGKGNLEAEKYAGRLINDKLGKEELNDKMLYSSQTDIKKNDDVLIQKDLIQSQPYKKVIKTAYSNQSQIRQNAIKKLYQYNWRNHDHLSTEELLYLIDLFYQYWRLESLEFNFDITNLSTNSYLTSYDVKAFEVMVESHAHNYEQAMNNLSKKKKEFKRKKINNFFEILNRRKIKLKKDLKKYCEDINNVKDDEVFLLDNLIAEIKSIVGTQEIKITDLNDAKLKLLNLELNNSDKSEMLSITQARYIISIRNKVILLKRGFPIKFTDEFLRDKSHIEINELYNSEIQELRNELKQYFQNIDGIELNDLFELDDIIAKMDKFVSKQSQEKILFSDLNHAIQYLSNLEQRFVDGSIVSSVNEAKQLRRRKNQIYDLLSNFPEKFSEDSLKKLNDGEIYELYKSEMEPKYFPIYQFSLKNITQDDIDEYTKKINDKPKYYSFRQELYYKNPIRSRDC